VTSGVLYLITLSVRWCNWVDYHKCPQMYLSWLF